MDCYNYYYERSEAHNCVGRFIIIRIDNERAVRAESALRHLINVNEEKSLEGLQTAHQPLQRFFHRPGHVELDW